MKTKFEFSLLSQTFHLRKTLAFILFVLSTTFYSQNTLEFTNGGVTGHSGVTQIQVRSALPLTNLNLRIAHTPGIQTREAPLTNFIGYSYWRK